MKRAASHGAITEERERNAQGTEPRGWGPLIGVNQYTKLSGVIRSGYQMMWLKLIGGRGHR